MQHSEKNSLKFEQTDIISENTKTKFDLIISNPPYITFEEYKNLDTSVKEFEPKIALITGDDGLEIYKKIIERTQTNITEKTEYFFEINPKTHKNLQQYLRKVQPGSKIKIIPDQFKVERFIQIQC